MQLHMALRDASTVHPGIIGRLAGDARYTYLRCLEVLLVCDTRVLPRIITPYREAIKT